MHDALLVGRFERFGDLPRDRQGLVDRNRAARSPLRQILALDELHDESVRASGLLEPVDGRNVRMVERRERPRLALEADQALGVRGKRVGPRREPGSSGNAWIIDGPAPQISRRSVR